MGIPPGSPVDLANEGLLGLVAIQLAIAEVAVFVRVAVGARLALALVGAR